MFIEKGVGTFAAILIGSIALCINVGLNIGWAVVLILMSGIISGLIGGRR